MAWLSAISRQLWGRLPRVWAFIALLAAVAFVLFAAGVSRLPQGGQALHVFWPLLAAAFAVVSAARVYIHFQRSSQAYSLSELPLVGALFFSSPDELLLARILGGLVGLGLITRQHPVKLAFNLASFAIETEIALLLFALLVPDKVVVSPATWLAVLLIALVVGSVGFLLSAAVITLSEGRTDLRRWRLPAVIGVGGSVANGMLGMAIVANIVSDVPVTFLLLVPVLTLAAAYTLYTREHEKREELQQLFQSSGLLQRSPEHDDAMPEFLQQLCDVFHCAAARLTLLPTHDISQPVLEIEVRDGDLRRWQSPLRLDVLERFTPLLEVERRSFIAVPPRLTCSVDRWLHEQRFRNAIGTALQGDGALLGTLVVADRQSDVNAFDAQDVTLLETFGAQASAAVQTSRLGTRLVHQAFHDPLTGLANRALLVDRLEHELRRRDGARRAVCVIFLDLDDFKVVNDTLGHAAGDAVLCAVAHRLQAVLRPSDTAARFGGDEFAVLLDTTEPYDAATVAERIITGLEHPNFTVGEREVAIRASVGVAVADTHVDAGELLRRADVAMYRAKSRHKGTFEVYEARMQEGITRRLELRSELELALQRDELRLHYQPVIDTATYEPVTLEALLRWTHRRFGVLNPGEFIGIAEESGLIHELGAHVLREACRQCRTWQTQAPWRASVSVNVSPRQLSEERFVTDVRRVLVESDLQPSRLVLEITETVMAEDMHSTRERLQELKATGVRIALDDFGTGYSSLAILQELPIDFLKIDRAFIERIADDPRGAALVQAMIRMGRTLGMRLIAEGVEHQVQLERLRALGCRLAQGYYFAHPAPAGEVTRLLRGVRYEASRRTAPTEAGERAG